MPESKELLKNDENMSKEDRASLKGSYWPSLGQLEYENK